MLRNRGGGEKDNQKQLKHLIISTGIGCFFTIKVSGRERECCTIAQRDLCCKVCCGSALCSGNNAICTTRSTMCLDTTINIYTTGTC